jgi:hypothetical protein
MAWRHLPWVLGAARLGEEHLRAAKQRDGLADHFALQLSVPDLRRAPAMDQTRLTCGSSTCSSASIAGIAIIRFERVVRDLVSEDTFVSSIEASSLADLIVHGN